MHKLLTGLALCSGALASPLAAQADAWQHKWFWGVQGGIIMYQTPTSTDWETALTVGGHWLITGGRSALYFAFDQVLFDEPNRGVGTTAVLDNSSLTGVRNIEFTRGRRIQAHVYVVPLDNWIQPYIGGGFSIHQVTNAFPIAADLATMTQSQLEGVLRTIDINSTKAFPVVTGGLQLRFSRLAAFGHYQYMPQGRNFLLTGVQHVFGAGIRYALTSSREEVSTRQ